MRLVSMQNIPKNLHSHFLPPDTHRYVYVYVVLPEILRRYQMHDPIVKSKVQIKNCYPFKRQFHKMVKHTQTILWQFPDELFECVWPFCGTGTYKVKVFNIHNSSK